MKYVQDFPSAPASEVVRLLISQPFVRDFADEIPVSLLGSEVTQVGDSFRHVMQCEFSTTDLELPSTIMRFLPAVVRLDWQQTWTITNDQQAEAELYIHTHGSPSATVNGRASLHAGPDSLRYTFEGTPSVSVPVAGKRLTGMLEKHLLTGVFDDQAKVMHRHLAG